MQYRRLGQTDIQVSVICLGTMTWGQQNSEAEAHEQLDYALAQGVNLRHMSGGGEQCSYPEGEPSSARKRFHLALTYGFALCVVSTTAAGIMQDVLGMQPPYPLLSVPVVTGTLGRILDRQTLKPAAILISCVTPDDAGEAATWPGVTVVTGRPGLATQRNAALAALPEAIDIVVFFDDDFVPEAGWLEAAAQRFEDEPDIVGLTGDVVADGIKGPGLRFTEVDRMLAALGPVEPAAPIEAFSPYGCNMAFRRSAIGTLRFDERLVLYGWLEDRDFGAALAARGGRLVKCLEARGVHMGVKGGRISGDRLGYSQIVNPLYMLRKGTMTLSQVFGQITRNVLSNVTRFAAPEPFIDRRGRLRGNLRGAADVLLGRLEPERALQIRRKA